mmetsp:Transcript_49668/g.142088  ORF Transcript_49668/g.142088 Transcript_49668/m.142088 type:complete len:234 (-) Transcript_49668:14-715(-)
MGMTCTPSSTSSRRWPAPKLLTPMARTRLFASSRSRARHAATFPARSLGACSSIRSTKLVFSSSKARETAASVSRCPKSAGGNFDVMKRSSRLNHSNSGSCMTSPISMWLLYIRAVSISRPPSRRKSRMDAFSGSPFADCRQQVPQPTIGIRSRCGVPGTVQTPQARKHCWCMKPGLLSHSPDPAQSGHAALRSSHLEAASAGATGGSRSGARARRAPVPPRRQLIGGEDRQK